MWATLGFVALAVSVYCADRFSIEAVSIGIITGFVAFFAFFAPDSAQANLSPKSLLSGFSDPALITIMALLVIGQAMFQTGALESTTMRINNGLESRPRRTLTLVFAIAFFVSMFLNNTPVVVMFIPVIASMSLRLRSSASRLMMPLSFICILAGMTTLIGSSTNLLVAGALEASTGQAMGFFDPTRAGLVLAAIGAVYIVIFGPILLPKRSAAEHDSTSGRQYIAQIEVTASHPLNGERPIAGLFPKMRAITVRMVLRGDSALLPPFEEPLMTGDILVVAATRKTLAKLLTSDSRYLKAMLSIDGFKASPDNIVISEAIIAPGSTMIDRSILQAGLRRKTGFLVLGIQRRSRMLRKKMLDIRLESGDGLLLFGHDSDLTNLRGNRDLLLLDWATKDLPDIRKSRMARLIFAAVVLAAAYPPIPIVLAALAGALAMIASGCLNIRQAVRALDMKIFLLIGAAFAMALALEHTGGARYIAMQTVNIFAPFGPQALIAALFLVIAILTNLLSNSATALLFAPIAINISQQTGIDPLVLLLTVIFAANCCFATPIAYQTNLLVMGPGQYKFSDYLRFGGPLVILLWASFVVLAPIMFTLTPI